MEGGTPCSPKCITCTFPNNKLNFKYFVILNSTLIFGHKLPLLFLFKTVVYNYIKVTRPIDTMPFCRTAKAEPLLILRRQPPEHRVLIHIPGTDTQPHAIWFWELLLQRSLSKSIIFLNHYTKCIETESIKSQDSLYIHHGNSLALLKS